MTDQRKKLGDLKCFHKQRGIVCATAIYSGAPKLSLSGQSNSALNVGADAIAEFKVDNDGKMYERDNSGAWAQIDTADDWIRPTTAAPGDYEVRYTGLTGDALDGATSAAEDTWRALSLGDFFFVLTDSSPFFGGKSATFTIEIRKGSSGAALVSASYTLTADREDF